MTVCYGTHMNTTPAVRYSAECQQCGNRHEAEYSHEGRFGEGPIFAVICDDGLTDYYTTELVKLDTAPSNPLGLVFSTDTKGA